MRLGHGGPAVLLFVALVVSGCSASSSGGAARSDAPEVTPSKAPTTVTEQFTLLPCPARPKTTVEIEGCTEHRIVRLDAEINAAFREVVNTATTGTVRAAIVSAQEAWIGYRQAQCQNESNVYAGGTLAPVAFASCEVRVDKARLADLDAMRTP